MKRKTLTSAVLAGVLALLTFAIASAQTTFRVAENARHNVAAAADIDAAEFGCASATDGQVLTCDGSSGTAFEGVPVAIPIYIDGTLSVGTGAATLHLPYGMTLSDVRIGVGTAPAGADLQVDVNEAGTTVFSTELTIDDGEATSTTAATPAVISDTALADGAAITVDVVQVGSGTAGADAIVWLIGTKP